jgi:site-specific DNA recombinase
VEGAPGAGERQAEVGGSAGGGKLIDIYARVSELKRQ